MNVEIAPALVGPLPEVQKHFGELYSRRNLFVNGSFPERVLHMVRRVSRIADSKRKGEKMPERLAKGVNYFFSLVNYFGGELDLTRGMMTKFPSHGCAYCGEKPCNCGSGSRPEPKVWPADPAQRGWTIRNWQRHLFETYGPNNIKRGFWEVLGRTISEFGELSILNAAGPARPDDYTLLMQECEKEAADFFSWIVALAYVEDIDLQDQVVKYYSVCPGCQEIPCECLIPSFLFKGDSFSLFRGGAV